MLELSPPVDKVNPRRNHLDALELLGRVPRVHVDPELGADGHVQEDEGGWKYKFIA